ncbi:uncharacterized protein EV420DRAFT_1484030 [Desarmillaria tabescens]|uniref:Uncharacterized protein n=1 Tax=Armillaria tabescens TaxID=1929756 RepID=A0AA39MUK4_ARMTA|nr:uncharacterized protein EV420DRAFT_1484030 [Desarmillaria tabescens]KAK0446599.1 hypothetical protein EV420DRAFT_1484030 [Desarmillaria tabescens]
MAVEVVEDTDVIWAIDRVIVTHSRTEFEGAKLGEEDTSEDLRYLGREIEIAEVAGVMLILGSLSLMKPCRQQDRRERWCILVGRGKKRDFVECANMKRQGSFAGINLLSSVLREHHLEECCFSRLVRHLTWELSPLECREISKGAIFEYLSDKTFMRNSGILFLNDKSSNSDSRNINRGSAGGSRQIGTCKEWYFSNRMSTSVWRWVISDLSW